jgi:isoquinoline 1-oxidoreductase alpha subunit
MVALVVNGARHELDVDEQMPLAWVLRDRLRLHGTRISCAAGLCGACTVHLNGAAVRSCQLPVGTVAGQAITTIENLSVGKLHPVQQAWMDESVVQCGYCQSGFIMAAAALLAQDAHPSDKTIDATLTNICKCGTYVRVRKAVHRAAKLLRERAR